MVLDMQLNMNKQRDQQKDRIKKNSKGYYNIALNIIET